MKALRILLMARLIQTKIKEPLAEELLFGATEINGEVVVDEQGGDLVLRLPYQQNA